MVNWLERVVTSIFRNSLVKYGSADPLFIDWLKEDTDTAEFETFVEPSPRLTAFTLLLLENRLSVNPRSRTEFKSFCRPTINESGLPFLLRNCVLRPF